MSVSELAAFEAAYTVLQPLDEAARRRALAWLSDALSQSKPLAQDRSVPVAAEAPVARRAKRGRPAGDGRRTRGSRKVAAETKASGRTYRRMPDPDEIMAAYQDTGTINGLAEHYGVPTHTVYSWARRLRGQGYHIGR